MKHKIVNFRADRISGWFYDPEAEGAKGALELLVNDEPVAAVTCNVFRGELSPEYFPNRNVGFLARLPPDYWTGATYGVSLRDRRTGRVLHEQWVETQDFHFVESPGFSGEFKLTEHGEIAGWAAQDHQNVNVRVFVDGHQVDDARAGQQKSLWAEDRLPMTAPVGFAYSFQVPADYFDDAEHRVQIVVAPDSEEIVLLDQVVHLGAGHAESAAEQTERLRRGAKDWSRRWRKVASKRDDLHVTRMELTPDYAAVTVAGTVRNKRAVLRLGEEVIALSAVTALHPEDTHNDQNGRLHRYAGVIPSSAWAYPHVSLFEAENDLTDTYDLRMGDESGRRPGELPTRLHTDFDGYRVTSPVELDAGRLEGWIIDTATIIQPNEIVLLSSTPEGTEELARAESSRTHRDVQIRYGISNSGGYSLPLPLQVLQDEPVHLQLVTKDDDGSTQLLWEHEEFRATDAFLLDQALNTPSTSKVVDLVQRSRASGREAVVEKFLTRHSDAQAPLALRDIEDALNSTASQDLSLEPTTGAIWYWVQELRRNDFLTVRWTTALEAICDDALALEARRAVMVANNQRPFESDGRRNYDVGVVTCNVERLFGVRPTCAPQSEHIGAMLKPLTLTSDLGCFSWKGIIEGRKVDLRNRCLDSQPMVGWHERDDSTKSPSSRLSCHQVYPVHRSARACVLSGTNTVMKRGFLPQHANGWDVYAFNEISVAGYLTDKIDFLDYFHSDDWVEDFGMAILKGMRSGVVSVLPEPFESVFSYAGPKRCSPHTRTFGLNNIMQNNRSGPSTQMMVSIHREWILAAPVGWRKKQLTS